MNIKFYKKNELVPTPEYMTYGAACFDITAFLETDDEIVCFDNKNQKISLVANMSENVYITLPPHSKTLIPTGLHFDLGEYSMRLHPRSGLAIKRGLTLINAEGVIDSDYIHEVLVPLWNTTSIHQTIYSGERICQAEIINTLQPSLIEISDKPEGTTNRTGGFGSTGV